MKKKRSIPFVAVLSRGGVRNAQLALADPKTPRELRVELERYLADPFAAAAEDQEKLLAEADARTEPFQHGRPRVEPQVQYLQDLVKNHPDLAHKPAKLRRLADESKLGEMSDTRFRAHVASARKSLGLS